MSAATSDGMVRWGKALLTREQYDRRRQAMSAGQVRRHSGEPKATRKPASRQKRKLLSAEERSRRISEGMKRRYAEKHAEAISKATTPPSRTEGAGPSPEVMSFAEYEERHVRRILADPDHDVRTARISPPASRPTLQPIGRPMAPPDQAARLVLGTTPAAKAQARVILASALDLVEQQIAGEIEKHQRSAKVAEAAVALMHADAKSAEYGRCLNALFAAAREYEGVKPKGLL